MVGKIQTGSARILARRAAEALVRKVGAAAALSRLEDIAFGLPEDERQLYCDIIDAIGEIDSENT